MTKIIYTFILICFISSCSEDYCLLKDGTYKVEFDEEFFSFQYKVKADTIEANYGDQTMTSIVEWISDNECFLNDLPSHITYKDDLNKSTYTFSKPFYRLIECSKDTIYFNLMRNENNVVNSGKLIKID
ncbi:hypothetical protein [Aequorivita marisscotiae]|uniref:Lipoprotein n=1 Tax=Aequorivita marisscotiae TaxID=3040348 RepID=A0ABY8KXS5_9FLAO|nr:hypothetical protein [Aequorivita sp. Ant34-E75]WGF92616.1 hypothetical protein QCQ61_00105 [Aequorivita sp. Ant34-E75]